MCSELILPCQNLETLKFYFLIVVLFRDCFRFQLLGQALAMETRDTRCPRFLGRLVDIGDRWGGILVPVAPVMNKKRVHCGVR